MKNEKAPRFFHAFRLPPCTKNYNKDQNESFPYKNLNCTPEENILKK